VLIVLLSAGAILTLAPQRNQIARAQETPAVAPPGPAENTPDGKVDASEDARAILRESLSLLGFDAAFFESFKDNEPLSEEEQTKLAKLLQGLPRIAKSTLLEAAGRQASLEPTSLERSSERGQAYALRVLLRRVTRQAVPEALQETLGYDSYFRCDVETVARRMVILVRQVPRAWKLDRPLNLQASAIAIYIKQMPSDTLPKNDESEDATPVLLFAADRLAWHPSTLLAHLGVDYGLFDGVEDRAPLKEREIFYQMLAAAGSMSPQYLDHQIQRLLEAQLERQERLARNPDLPAKKREAAERALERARSGASDVVPLFNEPANSRGEFVVLRGEAFRAIEIRVDDPQIRRRFHIDHYFEVEVVTPDSQNNPIVCCLAELPPEMPLGESVHVSVEVAGFFLKAYAFETRRSATASAGEKPQRQLAPLIVGKTLSVIPTPKFGTPTQSLTLAVGVLVVMAVCGAFMWHMRRTDRRAEQQLRLRRELLPEAISLDKSPISDADKS